MAGRLFSAWLASRSSSDWSSRRWRAIASRACRNSSSAPRPSRLSRSSPCWSEQMPAALDAIHAIGLVTCFALLGTSRIGACIRWLSLQGILFGLVPLIVHQGGLGWRAGLLAAGNIALKGIAFPALLLRLRARADYNREVQPFVSFVMSILFGIFAL